MSRLSFGGCIIKTPLTSIGRADPIFHYIGAIMGAIASQITGLKTVYSTIYSGEDQRKHQSSASLAFVRGIHRDRWIPVLNDSSLTHLWIWIYIYICPCITRTQWAPTRIAFSNLLCELSRSESPEFENFAIDFKSIYDALTTKLYMYTFKGFFNINKWLRIPFY